MLQMGQEYYAILKADGFCLNSIQIRAGSVLLEGDMVRQGQNEVEEEQVVAFSILGEIHIHRRWHDSIVPRLGPVAHVMGARLLTSSITPLNH